MFKEAIVNTRLGVSALDLRDRLRLYRAVSPHLESLGHIANDSLARRLVERLCEEGRIFIDVGAHIGSVVNGVQRRSKPSRIVAIEADPAKAAALRKRFPRAVIHNFAVGDTDGEVPFFIAPQKDSGYSSLDPKLADRMKVQQIMVPIRRVDELVEHHGVDLMKIDVEGAELAVLRGSEALVAGSRPTIMFESNPWEMEGLPKAELWEWFDKRDYAVVVPNRVAHDDPGMSLETFLEAHREPQRTTNYFAIAGERRDAVRTRARAVLGLG